MLTFPWVTTVTPSCQHFTYKVQLNEVKTKALVDNGSTSSFIHPNIFTICTSTVCFNVIESSENSVYIQLKDSALPKISFLAIRMKKVLARLHKQSHVHLQVHLQDIILCATYCTCKYFHIFSFSANYS